MFDARLPGLACSVGLTLFLLLAGCSRPHGDPIVEFDDDDPEMNAAIDEARRTLDDFIAHLQAFPDDDSHLIKAPIDTGEQIEHIWIEGLQFDGEQFIGTLANQPHDLSTYKQGDQVVVPKGEISDWAYFEGDVMKGGYTIKVMEKRMEE